MSKGTYFLGRVAKVGVISAESLIEAIVNSEKVKSREYEWMITDANHCKGDFEYVYGNLSKYDPDGQASVVDERQKKTREDYVPNLAIASAPFVYIPEFSGIAYLRVWNKIDPAAFKAQFSAVISAYHQNMFAELHINDIDESHEFEKKVKRFTAISKIKCSINQPNPLYGDIWKHLKEHLIKRNSAELKIEETEKNSEGIKTNLTSFDQIQNQEISISDAAICMALDGYGKGAITGICDGKTDTLMTGRTVVEFKHEKIPNPDELALEAYHLLKKVSDERGLKH